MTRRLLAEADGILVAIRARCDSMVCEPEAAPHHARAIKGLAATARAAIADFWAPAEESDDRAAG